MLPAVGRAGTGGTFIHMSWVPCRGLWGSSAISLELSPGTLVKGPSTLVPSHS